jgi:hypothetical protein
MTADQALEELYAAEIATPGREASTLVFNFVLDRAFARDSKSVEDYLTKIDFTKLSAHSTAGVIRVTAHQSAAFSDLWQRRLLDAQARLLALGVNPNKILVGITGVPHGQEVVG